jgi:DNA gyrase subunit B
MLANPLFKALIDAIGAGVADDFDVTKCRYSRIILLMDPDADGIHCGVLMLLFFHQLMSALLEKNMLEIVRPPVGEVVNKQTNTMEYAYTDAQFMTLICEQKMQLNQSLESIKYGGLAGIAANKLEELCINPQTRKTSVMGIKDAQMALEIFGSTSI